MGEEVERMVEEKKGSGGERGPRGDAVMVEAYARCLKIGITSVTKLHTDRQSMGINQQFP